ncbi:MAG: ABC transporter ATP-binding protein [Bacteroidales bacterium]|nr:ABC transporter ATP-binding protein [Bacteroidales bacterium]
MSIIEVKNVNKIYSTSEVKVHAVRGVELNINQGEFTAIVGPSGSGKTTLLNMIGGLDDVTDGNIFVDGTDITQLKDSQMIDFRMKYIGFVFQAYNLIPVLTALENVEFIMSLQGVNKKERRQRSIKLLEAVGLGDRINSRPSRLSGGQQQRVAVARALASKPKFVLADEPTANLDSVSTNTLLEIMKNLNEKEGTTFVFSTHDSRVIEKAKRVVTLEDGKIISDVTK